MYIVEITMNHYKKILLSIILLSIFIMIACLLYVGAYFKPISRKDADERITSLLYKTDPNALLSACRKVLKEASVGKWGSRQYSISHKPDPDAYKLPKIILDLNPNYIEIYAGTLRIEMFGGFTHAGVYAFPEDYADYSSDKKLIEGLDAGDKKLIEGLWYYDDGYRKVKDYETYIQSLKPSEEK